MVSLMGALDGGGQERTDEEWGGGDGHLLDM